MNIIDELEKLKKERSTTAAPFDSLDEFEKWADAVRPLLSFSDKHSGEFSRSVTSATVTARMGSPEDAKTNMNNAVGILNQAIVAAKLEAEYGSSTQTSTKTELDKKSIKEQFESNPIIWGLGLLCVGSIAGYGFNETISNKIAPQKTQVEKAIPQEISCKIEGLEKLAEAHHGRVSALQAQLMKHESGASDGTLIPTYRQENKDSAKRIRDDISIENVTFEKNVTALEKSCQ